MRGWSGDLNLNRQSGSVTVNAALWAVSPGFESNDIGFQNGGDAAGTHTVVFWKKTDPDRYTRVRQAWFSKWWTWDFGRKVTGNGWNGSAFIQYLNYWDTFMNFGAQRQAQDDQLTRGGPAALRLPGQFFNFGFDTDSRKKVSLGAFYGMGRNKPNAWNISSNVE